MAHVCAFTLTAGISAFHALPVSAAAITEETAVDTERETLLDAAGDGYYSSSTPSSNSGGGRSVVPKMAYYDCNGSGHGYYEITYSDGSVEYEEF